jgi:signal peptidase I
VLLVAGALASGRVAYVVTNGVSMEPTYHAGDFVVLARSGSYREGDIVAYRGVRVGRPVILHRIVGGDADGYDIQGDNNQSTDPTHPRADQIIGRAVLHAPRIGAFIGSPITRISLPAALLGLVALLVKKPASRRRAAQVARQASGRSRTGWKALIAIDLVLVAAVGLMFGFASPTHPRPAPFNQTGVLTYQARPPVSDTYPAGEIATGDPVFVKLINTIDVSFHYTTDAPADSVSGTVQLDATISTGSGWHTSLALTSPTPLADGAADVSAPLDLARIQLLAANVAIETGVVTGPINVTITASANTAVGAAETVAYSSALPMQLNALELTLANVEPAVSPYGPAVVSTRPLTAQAPSLADPTNNIAHKIRLGALALLLLTAAATAVVWPVATEQGGNSHSAAVVRTPSIGIRLADSTNQIQVADPAALVQVALRLDSPVVQRGDGWEGVFGPHAVYWTMTPRLPAPTIGTASDVQPASQRRPARECDHQLRPCDISL